MSDQKPARRLTKEEMIEKGLLPPSKSKSMTAEFVQPQVEQVTEEEAPVVTPEVEHTISTTQTDENLLVQFSNRASLVVSFVNSMLSSGIMNPIDEVLDHAFELADEIQERTNRDYIQAVVRKQVEDGIAVRANKD